MTRSDTIVIILMLILLSAVYSYYWSFSSDQNSEHYAQITITAASPQKISLHENKIYTVPGRLGNSKVQVKDSKIRFLNSPCHNKYCIHSGWLKNTGAIAACLPNGITLSIKNVTNLYDAINF
jgi:hypothetical protein